jgi:hypothetical protein
MASRRLTGNLPTEITLPRYSPTEFTEFTEEVAESILPQISQIDTDRQVHHESSICENLCNPWENIQQEGSVYSVNSVGEYTARRFCENLCNLWENTFSNLFREFREFCGRIYGKKVLCIP